MDEMIEHNAMEWGLHHNFSNQSWPTIVTPKLFGFLRDCFIDYMKSIGYNLWFTYGKKLSTRNLLTLSLS